MSRIDKRLREVLHLIAYLRRNPGGAHHRRRRRARHAAQGDARAD